ncbi:MAG: calcium-translocating P-type ATPase, PMCA-type [Prevotellaceae bacterium]|jgi:Ca2+-transporting ATPase|nr:calcium-translocating P-type ATPase, PMCA-type [Prevotellaceae bacterium]
MTQSKKSYVGLSDAEVAESRRRHGENVLTPPKKTSLLAQLLEKFQDPIIRILLLALLASFGVAAYQLFMHLHGASVFLEPVGILVAILLATCVGFAFELSANKKFELLNQMNDDTPVKVIRGGAVREVPKREVVVGDTVLLEVGEEVPADGRLLEAISLQVNESTLTGEPVASKTTNPQAFGHEATYRPDEVLRGTTVVDGHGVMEVLAVGDATEYGKVYEGSQIDSHIETPLNQQLRRLGKLISCAGYSVAGLIVVARVLFYFASASPISWVDAGSHILNSVMIAVTLIVVAVPEGLPMSVTLSLALSMKRMLAANNLVRKMHACETMGAATVICTDKTGTLTQNQMRVHQADFYGYNGAGLAASPAGRLAAESIAVNSTAHLDLTEPGKAKVLGNPTEGALLLWLRDNGLSYLDLRSSAEVLAQLTFSTERKYMATIAESPAAGGRALYVKGAPEVVLARCQSVLLGEGTAPVAAHRERIEQQLAAYQRQAMRTLGFAYKPLPAAGQPSFDGGPAAEGDLTFLGIAAIADPVREDVPAAIESCLHAGIDVKIVTGDTPGTAKEVGRQVGLWRDSYPDSWHTTGAEFAATPDAALLDTVLDLKIMSRARPMDKERLVKLLQQKGQVVAVTGDGTNDAPALNAAQVGLSMGDGTSVAKEASAITILDNSFKSITRAVMWGRSLYQNIQRFILFQMTINVVACFIVLVGSLGTLPAPLTITQMLWVNLIIDTFAALALASLPPNEKVMRLKPRKATDHVVTPKMGASIVAVGLLFALALLGLLQYFRHFDVTGLAQLKAADFFASYLNFRYDGGGELTAYERSLFFTIFVLLQLWNMFNAKAFSAGRSALAGLRSCLSGFGAVVCAVALGQYLIVTFGGEMFSVVPLRTADWLIAAAATSAALWAGELVRWGERTYKKRGAASPDAAPLLCG